MLPTLWQFWRCAPFLFIFWALRLAFIAPCNLALRLEVGLGMAPTQPQVLRMDDVMDVREVDSLSGEKIAVLDKVIPRLWEKYSRLQKDFGRMLTEKTESPAGEVVMVVRLHCHSFHRRFGKDSSIAVRNLLVGPNLVGSLAESAFDDKNAPAFPDPESVFDQAPIRLDLARVLQALQVLNFEHVESEMTRFEAVPGLGGGPDFQSAIFLPGPKYWQAVAVVRAPRRFPEGTPDPRLNRLLANVRGQLEALFWDNEERTRIHALGARSGGSGRQLGQLKHVPVEEWGVGRSGGECSWRRQPSEPAASNDEADFARISLENCLTALPDLRRIVHAEKVFLENYINIVRIPAQQEPESVVCLAAGRVNAPVDHAVHDPLTPVRPATGTSLPRKNICGQPDDAATTPDDAAAEAAEMGAFLVNGDPSPEAGDLPSLFLHMDVRQVHSPLSGQNSPVHSLHGVIPPLWEKYSKLQREFGRVLTQTTPENSGGTTTSGEVVMVVRLQCDAARFRRHFEKDSIATRNLLVSPDHDHEGPLDLANVLQNMQLRSLMQSPEDAGEVQHVECEMKMLGGPDFQSAIFLPTSKYFQAVAVVRAPRRGRPEEGKDPRLNRLLMGARCQLEAFFQDKCAGGFGRHLGQLRQAPVEEWGLEWEERSWRRQRFRWSRRADADFARISLEDCMKALPELRRIVKAKWEPEFEPPPPQALLLRFGSRFL